VITSGLDACAASHPPPSPLPPTPLRCPFCAGWQGCQTGGAAKSVDHKRAGRMRAHHTPSPPAPDPLRCPFCAGWQGCQSRRCSKSGRRGWTRARHRTPSFNAFLLEGCVYRCFGPVALATLISQGKVRPTWVAEGVVTPKLQCVSARGLRVPVLWASHTGHAHIAGQGKANVGGRRGSDTKLQCTSSRGCVYRCFGPVTLATLISQGKVRPTWVAEGIPTPELQVRFLLEG